MLTILQNLVNFGFYGSRGEIVDLCNPMIATLDGRADKIHATAQAGDPARKVFDDCTSLVMDSKRQMINSLYAICSLRDDYRLSLVMYSFRQSVDSGLPLVKQDDSKAGTWLLIDKFQEAFNDVFEAGGDIDGTALDLDAMSVSPLSTILMDLMMYNNPELFEASLSLLETIFSQRVAIIEAMENVQLLLNENVPTFGTMTAMTAEVSMLRNYVESYETWGVANSFSPIDEGIVASVLASLDKLGKMCFEPPNTVLDPAMAPTNTKDGPTKEWQDLQRNMDIHSLLIRGVEIPYNTFKVHHASTGGYGESETTKTENRNKQASYDALKSVVAKSWQTSLAFLKGNKENQKIYYEFRNFMIEEMRTAPELGIATILIEVFRDNIKTIEAAEDTLFMTFAHMLGSESDPSTRLSYLTFFEVMVEVTNFGIVQASQRKAIRALVDPTFKDSILVLEPPPEIGRAHV